MLQLHMITVIGVARRYRLHALRFVTALTTVVVTACATATDPLPDDSGTGGTGGTGGGGGGGGTNPPGAVDTIFFDGFETGGLSTAWTDGYNAARHEIITDPALASSGTRLLRVTVPQGGDGGWLTHWFMPGYDSAHVRLRIRYDPAWTGGSKILNLRGSRTDNRWSGFGQAGVCPNGTDFFNAGVTLSATHNPGPLRFYSMYPGMGTGTCWGDEGSGATYSNPTAGLSRGVWHTVDFWVRLNTPGQSNGLQQLWLDGQLWGEWRDMRFRSSTILTINSLQLNLSTSPNSGGRIYFDDVIVTRQRLR
jgi:hypothetical protein